MNMKEKKRNFLKKYVITAQGRGQIRKDIDIDLITCIINQISVPKSSGFSFIFRFEAMFIYFN